MNPARSVKRCREKRQLLRSSPRSSTASVVRSTRFQPQIPAVYRHTMLSGHFFPFAGMQTWCFWKCTFSPPATCFDQSRLLLAASCWPQHCRVQAPHSPCDATVALAHMAEHSLLCVLPSAPQTAVTFPEHFLSTKQAAYLSSSYAVVQSHPLCASPTEKSPTCAWGTGVRRKSAHATETIKNFMGASSQRWLRSAEGLEP